MGITRIRANTQIKAGTVDSTNVKDRSLIPIDFAVTPVVVESLTTAERDALTDPVAGLQILNTTVDRLEYYTGTEWLPVGLGDGITGATGVAGAIGATGMTGAAGSSIQFFDNYGITGADGINKIFTIYDTMDVDSLNVYYNGLRLSDHLDYTVVYGVSDTTLTFDDEQVPHNNAVLTCNYRKTT